MKVVVLAGGTSSERDVSIVSGTGALGALRKNGHRAAMLDVFFGCGDEEADIFFDDPRTPEEMAEAIKKNNGRLEEEMSVRRSFFGPNVIRLCTEADAVFLALHGANGEDGRLQAAFDLLGVSYTGTDYLSSALAMDKERTKEQFRLYGIPTPKGGCVTAEDGERSCSRFGIALPVVVKPCCGGSSVGTSIASTDSEYEKALDEAFLYGDRAVVEEYISGREFAVAVIEDRAYPVIEIAPVEGFYNYENKYKKGAAVETCPADISAEKTAEMQRIAERAAKALGITGYSRLDFLMKETGELYCLEANTLPGLTPTSLLPQEAAALGISYGELCDKLLGLRKGIR